jgi:hypothetical protein
MKQNLIIVARDNRKKLKKNLTKTQLKDIWNPMSKLFTLSKCVHILQWSYLIKSQDLHVSVFTDIEFFNKYIWTQEVSENGKNLRTHQN